MRGSELLPDFIGTVLIPNHLARMVLRTVPLNTKLLDGRVWVTRIRFTGFIDLLELRQLSIRAVARRHMYPPLELDSRINLAFD